MRWPRANRCAYSPQPQKALNKYYLKQKDGTLAQITWNRGGRKRKKAEKNLCKGSKARLLLDKGVGLCQEKAGKRLMSVGFYTQ